MKKFGSGCAACFKGCCCLACNVQIAVNENTYPSPDRGLHYYKDNLIELYVFSISKLIEKI